MFFPVTLVMAITEPSIAEYARQIAPTQGESIAIWGAVTGTAGICISILALLVSFLQYRHTKAKDEPRLRIETFVDYIQSTQDHQDDMLIVGVNIYNESSFCIYLDDFITEPQRGCYPLENVCMTSTTIGPSERQSGNLVLRLKIFPIESAYFLDTHSRRWCLSRAQLKEINAAIHDRETRNTANGTA